MKLPSNLPETAPTSNWKLVAQLALLWALAFALGVVLFQTAARADLLPVSSLPILEPAIPNAPTTSSTTADKTRWLWANWQYQDNLKNRAAAASLAAQVAVLKGQLATATQMSGGSVSVDLTPVTKAVTALGVKIDALGAALAPAENLTVQAGGPGKGATITWDYTGDATKISGFRIYAQTAAGGDYGIIASPPANVRTFTTAPLSPGTYVFTVRAWVQSASLAQESTASNPAAFIALAP